MNEVVTKGPCPECGSSDACAVYTDGTGYCFSCDKYIRSEQLDGSVEVQVEQSHSPVALDNTDLKMKGTPRAISDRRIDLATVRKYNVHTVMQEHRIVQHCYPYTHSVTGEMVSYKVRDVEKKAFYNKGDVKSAGLFGMSLFPAGSALSITVTEGELDALAAYQMQGSKWPVVSLKNGAGSASRDLKADEEVWRYLNSFDNIVVSFDNDKPGRDNALAFSKMFKAGKVKIMTARAPYKDACDYLKDGQSELYVKDWWNAEIKRPDGILLGQALIDKVMNKPNITSFPVPYKGLQDLTYGLRTSELWILIAGTGIGKTLFMRELMMHTFNTQGDHKIGCLFLEETATRTSEGFAGIQASIPFHLPDAMYTKEQKVAALQETIGTERIIVYDSFAENNVDRVLEIMEFMVLVYDCKWLLLDHISMLVAEQANFGGLNERQQLDNIAVRIRKLAQELDVGILGVSHTRRPSGSVSHEEGGAVRTNDIRGTGGIAQVSDMILSLQRDGQAESEVERNTTRVRVLKNRFSGLTGPACSLLYDNETGRLTEIEPDNEDIDDDEG